VDFNSTKINFVAYLLGIENIHLVILDCNLHCH